MLVGFAGALIRSGSKLKLLVAKTQSVVASFDEDDITDLKVVQKGLDQKINRFGIEYFQWTNPRPAIPRRIRYRWTSRHKSFLDWMDLQRSRAQNTAH